MLKCFIIDSKRKITSSKHVEVVWLVNDMFKINCAVIIVMSNTFGITYFQCKLYFVVTFCYIVTNKAEFETVA